MHCICKRPNSIKVCQSFVHDEAAVWCHHGWRHAPPEHWMLCHDPDGHLEQWRKSLPVHCPEQEGILSFLTVVLEWSQQLSSASYIMLQTALLLVQDYGPLALSTCSILQNQFWQTCKSTAESKSLVLEYSWCSGLNWKSIIVAVNWIKLLNYATSSLTSPLTSTWCSTHIREKAGSKAGALR